MCGAAVIGIFIFAVCWFAIGFGATVAASLILPRDWELHPSSSESAGYMTCAGVFAFIGVTVCCIGYGCGVLWEKFLELPAIDKLFNRGR